MMAGLYILNSDSENSLSSLFNFFCTEYIYIKKTSTHTQNKMANWLYNPFHNSPNQEDKKICKNWQRITINICSLKQVLQSQIQIIR